MLTRLGFATAGVLALCVVTLWLGRRWLGGPAAQSGGVAATTSTSLNALDDNTAHYQTGDTILITGTTTTGMAVNATLTVGATAPTLGDLVNAINSNFPGSTASIDASGKLVVTANGTGPSQLALTISDAAADKGSTNWSNQVLGVTTAGKNGDTTTTGIQFFDAQGSPHTLTVTFQKQSNNTWSMTGSIPSTDGTMSSSQINGLTFNSNGSFSQVAGAGGTASMTVNLTGQPAQTITFNLGTSGSFSGLTQVGSASTAAATDQNGFGAGTLSNVTIDQTGLINGVFSNGQVLAIGQLAIANFANPQGLTREGNNYVSLSSDSGTPLIGTGNSGGRGTVQQGQLEDSNVDVSLEFTKLIIAQRGFELNAHSITAGDQVLQDLVNIIH
jgi:flagellar hook protein FlgE